MTPPSGIKVLAFDVFGTVVDWRGGVVAEMAAIAKERQLTVDAGAFADGWRSKYLPVRPEESMMVASHSYDLAAAAGEGMRTAFVRRPHEWGSGKPEKLDISVDIVADDFLDLATQLGA